MESKELKPSYEKQSTTEDSITKMFSALGANIPNTDPIFQGKYAEIGQTMEMQGYPITIDDYEYFRNQIKIWLLYFFAVATSAIHPLAGVPLLIVIILLNLFKLLYSSYIKYISVYFLAGLVFILFLPLAFLLNGSEVIATLPALHKADFAWFGWVDKFDLPLNLVYLVEINKIVIK